MAHAYFIESGETVTARPSIPITGEEVIPEEIDLHSTLPTQTAIKGGKFQIINVQNAIERKGLISFRIVSGDNQFIDPYNTYVLICGQEYPGRERSHKDFQATESPCKKKCATEHGGPRILDVSLPV